jgi:predicted aconitase with swiveling domain
VIVQGQPLVPGSAEGAVLKLDEPLSFWGGVDPASGRIVDVHHPQHRRSVRGRVLIMPAGRGSSSSSSTLLECVRAGTAPAAIVLGRADPILPVAAVVARELYGRGPAVVRIYDGVERLPSGGLASVHPDGKVAITGGNP